RHLVELRAAALVRLDRQHLSAGVQLDRMVRDVVRQLTADQANRDRAIREVINRPGNFGHLPWIRHGEAPLPDRSVRRAKDTKGTEDTKSDVHPAASVHAFVSSVHLCVLVRVRSPARRWSSERLPAPLTEPRVAVVRGLTVRAETLG